MVMYDPKDDESLWPTEGYAVIEMDEFKHPSSDDFMIMLAQFDDPTELTLPVNKVGYRYYVHSADMESWTTESWEEIYDD